MCLSVYLGTGRPLDLPQAPAGHLGIKTARWTPPPLKSNHPFVYSLGALGPDGQLACSCLLMEWIEWTEAGPTISSDAPDDPPCPFEDLRALCDEATRDGGSATIVCDDSGGLELDCDEEDYCTIPVRLHSIARGNLLFADLSGMFPWRALQVIR
jgi:hypothetical protein